MPPLCRETQSLGQQMLNATVGINGLSSCPDDILSHINPFSFFLDYIFFLFLDLMRCAEVREMLSLFSTKKMCMVL